MRKGKTGKGRQCVDRRVKIPGSGLEQEGVRNQKQGV